jgi:adenosylcobinamide-GDP ribazoletransferase
VITLVLGGVRSGKSEVAEALVGARPATYLATAALDGHDDDFTARVERHRARRPSQWTTVEETKAVPEVLAVVRGPVLLDALGTWLANDLEGADVDALVEALRRRGDDTVVVSEEVGLGVHPPTEVGRRFADRLGEINRRVAELSDRCLLVVAGRVVELPAGASSHPPGETTPTGISGSRPGASGLGSALAFLTPLGRATTPGATTFSWFPVAGALLGLLLGLWWWLAGELTTPLLAAALVVVADLGLTGALHFDGLVDSADGLLPHLPRERRLAVLAEPATGAFGVAAGAGALLLRTAALAGFAGPRPLLLGALWSASRTSMAVIAHRLPYARPEGLASAFLDGRGPAVLLAGGATLVLVLAALDGGAALAGLAAAALAAAGVATLARRRLGGFTGDTLGAAGVVAETAGLVVAAVVAA